MTTLLSNQEKTNSLTNKHNARTPATLLSLLIALTISACNDDSHSPSSPDSMKGTWLRDGYHQYIKIDEDVVSFYEYTPNKSSIDQSWCFISEQFELDEFNEIASPELSADYSRLEFDALELLLDDGGSRSYESVETMPDVCANGGMLTAEDVGFEGNALDDYNLFWHLFDVHYPSFELKNIDWNERYNDALGHVNEATTPEDLLEVMTESLANISDPHISVSLDDEYPDIPGSVEDYIALFQSQFDSTGEQGDIEEYIDLRIAQFKSTLSEVYLDKSGELEVSGGSLTWGTLAKAGSYNIGFIRLDSFLPESKENDFFDNYIEMLSTLDQAMSELENTESLIIDVRFNGGGAETIGFHLANHFTDEERFIFSKQAYSKDGSAPVVPYYISPNGYQMPYLKPVRILVGSYSVSAAETLPMMMRVLPNVQLVGKKTSGSIATAIERFLPYSGIAVEVPAEIYKTFDDKVFEGVGVEVDIEVEEFSLQDFYENKDSMLDMAILSLINE